MRSYERSGITVDQCSECRGIFLDRGELERLVDAETAFHSAAAAPAPVSPAYGSPGGERSRDEQPQARYRDDRDRDDRYRDNRDRDDRYKDDRYRSNDGYSGSRKKKRSFLEDLFD